KQALFKRPCHVELRRRAEQVGGCSELPVSNIRFLPEPRGALIQRYRAWGVRPGYQHVAPDDRGATMLVVTTDCFPDPVLMCPAVRIDEGEVLASMMCCTEVARSVRARFLASQGPQLEGVASAYRDRRRRAVVDDQNLNGG